MPPSATLVCLSILSFLITLASMSLAEPGTTEPCEAFAGLPLTSAGTATATNASSLGFSQIPSSNKRGFADDPTIALNGAIWCGSHRCLKTDTQSCCNDNTFGQCCPLKNAVCCSTYCCNSTHPICCGGNACCPSEFSTCCGNNITAWCCGPNMACGSTVRTCNRADSAFPRVALGIIVSLLGLTIIFQLFRFCASKGILGRSLQAPAGSTLVSQQEEMTSMGSSSILRGGEKGEEEDNSVIELDAMDEPPARHRRPNTAAEIDD